MSDNSRILPLADLIHLQDKLCSAGSLDQETFAALFGHIQAQGDELREVTELNERMAGFLTKTANALKGEPVGTTIAHDWTDLPELALSQRERMEAAEVFTTVLRCDLRHEEPFDFAQCQTHDVTFPLGKDCPYSGKSVVDYLEDAQSAQRYRAVVAEEKLEELQDMDTEYSGNHALSDRQVLDDDDEPFSSLSHLQSNFADYSSVVLESRQVTAWRPLPADNQLPIDQPPKG